MVHRLTWFAAAAGIILALLRMERLLRVATQGPPWQLVLIAALLLGGVITWVAFAYRVRPAAVVLLNLAGLVLATIRIAAPDTAVFGVVPTLSTISETVRELAFALELIRFGTAPVVPVAGIVLILTWIFWVIGMMIVWALHVGRPIIAVVPGLIMYLQLATMDRVPPGRGWTGAFVAIVILSLVAVAYDERTVGTGRLRDRNRKYLPAMNGIRPVAFVALVVLVSIVGSATLANRVPEQGVLNWRSRTGFGNGIFGGVSYNLFVGIQQDLVSLSDEPVFTARVQGDVDADQVYWKLIALEAYDGTNWFPQRSTIVRPEQGAAWENADQTFVGQTTRVVQEITVNSLRQNYLPAVYSPVGLSSSSDILTESFRIREDGALRFDALTFDGLTYTITSQMPDPNYNVLASEGNALSPIFEEARNEGAFVGRATTPGRTQLPEDLEPFLELPAATTAGSLPAFARELTAAADTDFEKAVFIEAFLRGDNFTYDTGIDAGHSALDLEDWLTDTSSPSYRTGYCEQFATAMAVMARTLDIPSRVILGFAPGDLTGDGIVTVRQSDAHSWVELWFPDQGWVQFDPTPRRQGDNPSLVEDLGFDPRNYIPIEENEPAAEQIARNNALDGPDLDLIAEINDSPGVDGPFIPQFEGELPTRIPRPLLVTVVIAALASLIPGFKWLRRRRRIRRLHEGDIGAAWAEIVDQLSDLGQPAPRSFTPAEVASSTTRELEPLAQRYSRVLYGPEEGAALSTVEVNQAASSYAATERYLAAANPRWKNILRWFRLRSIRRHR